MTARGPAGRLAFLDGLRGLALIFMVVNHTARWWLGGPMSWPRYHLIYLSMVASAPIFLFLAGFSLALAYARATVDRGLGRARVALGFVRRGLGLILAGFALTLLVFPTEPLLETGVLQTIGFGIVLLAPALLVLDRPWAPTALVLLAAALYASFALAQPVLRAWLAAHPTLAEIWFADYPLWPWLALLLVGAVLGRTWALGARRGAAQAPAVAGAAAAGTACLSAYVALELSRGPVPHLAFTRDFVLNRHWTPAPITGLAVLGLVATVFACAWWALEARRWRAGWLVLLGRHALLLYFAHQVIAFTLVREWLGVTLESWWAYALANAALVAGLVLLARARVALPRF